MQVVYVCVCVCMTVKRRMFYKDSDIFEFVTKIKYGAFENCVGCYCCAKFKDSVNDMLTAYSNAIICHQLRSGADEVNDLRAKEKLELSRVVMVAEIQYINDKIAKNLQDFEELILGTKEWRLWRWNFGISEDIRAMGLV